MNLVAVEAGRSANETSQPSRPAGGDRSSRSGPSRLISLGVVVMLAAMGASCGAVVSRHVWRIADLAVPWGLLLAVAGSVAAVVAARSVGKAGGFLAAAGWIVGLVLALSGPGGDVIVASDALGYAFLLISTAAVFITAMRRHPGA